MIRYGFRGRKTAAPLKLTALEFSPTLIVRVSAVERPRLR